MGTSGKDRYCGRFWGAILGFLLGGGPLGAVIGFLLGYFLYDKKRLGMEDARRAQASFTSEAKDNHELIMLTFMLMGFVARGAGRVNEQHIRTAERYMALMQLDAQMRSDARDAFNLGKGEGFDLTEATARLHRICNRNLTMVGYILEIVVQIALSDGILEQDEHDRIIEIAVRLGISANSAERLIQAKVSEMAFRKNFQEFFEERARRQGESAQGGRAREEYERTRSYGSADDLGEAYRLLESKPSDDLNTIRKSHRRMMMKYHPDRVKAQGLPPEMAKVYEEKAKTIQAAFDLIKRSRGG
ncbi:MAG: co-chaperone DjlA [Succinivibrionaceae bacterium]|nr:co-chaperone DjlA [Succinivibrionaceae bacterium]